MYTLTQEKQQHHFNQQSVEYLKCVEVSFCSSAAERWFQKVQKQTYIWFFVPNIVF